MDPFQKGIGFYIQKGILDLSRACPKEVPFPFKSIPRPHEKSILLKITHSYYLSSLLHNCLSEFGIILVIDKKWARKMEK